MRGYYERGYRDEKDQIIPGKPLFLNEEKKEKFGVVHFITKPFTHYYCKIMWWIYDHV